MTRFAFAETEDSWSWEGDFATREEAVEAAREELGPGEGFVTGIQRDATREDVYPGGMALALLDALVECERAEHGTPIESYVNDVYESILKPAFGGKDTRLVDDLERRLKAAFLDWAKEHLPEPGWFFVESVEDHAPEQEDVK